MEFAGVSIENQGMAKALQDEICESSAHAHAAMAKVAMACARFDEIGGWCDGGIRSFPHWLAINAGFDNRTGGQLLRVGQALTKLPMIAEAFSAGRLSFDKVRQVTWVATPATEQILLEIALGASGAQLERICCALRRIEKARAPKQADYHLRLRGLWTGWDEDGMLELKAKLTPEDAAVLQAALESITGSRPVPPPIGEGASDPADDRWAARRADALVAMCENVLAGGADGLVKSGAATQVVVHVDVGILTGESSDGRCYVEGGSPLSTGAARRLACDAEVVGVFERDGLPIDVGRKQRLATDRQRVALGIRDRFCLFPGCGVPAHRTEVHHHEHWASGGETNLANLLLLCGFHHRRHHEGTYLIGKRADGFAFETNDGMPIRPPARDPVVLEREPSIGPLTPWSQWGGERMDFGYAVSVIADSCELAEARAAPPS
ncbi:MAG TPA: DUF222 domain-containing protein [Candidatus Dormibacteraeota bacterium]|nr:DUF222 domain-containing protein [Candidatus Dormibacteraeota bacterium]